MRQDVTPPIFLFTRSDLLLAHVKEAREQHAALFNAAVRQFASSLHDLFAIETSVAVARSDEMLQTKTELDAWTAATVVEE